MIDDVDQFLARWSETVIPGTPVSLIPPGRIEDRPCVGIYLIDLLHAPARHDSRAVPLQLTLRYLVTAWHEDPQAAHGLLGRLLSAASESDEFDIELQPLSPEAWKAFGVPPQPAFLLRVPLRIQRPEPRAHPVHERVEIIHRSLGSLTGFLLGPDDVPIPNARIELMGCDAKARSDNKGRFRFDAIPATPQTRRLRIFAKGRTLMARTNLQQDESKPVIIRLDQLEE